MKQSKSYNDFMTHNIVNDKNVNNPVAILQQIAEESFEVEKKFYQRIGLSNKVYGKDAKATTNLLQNSQNFNDYQTELCLKVFGASHEEYLFLKYFYDSRFIKALSAENPGKDLLKTLSKDLLDYYMAMSSNSSVSENIENSSNGIDFQDFVNYLKEILIDDQKKLTSLLKEPKPKNLTKYFISYIVKKEKININPNEQRKQEQQIVKQYSSDLKKIITYIQNIGKNVDTTNTSKNRRGYSVLRLANIQFIDDDHTFKNQFENFVETVLTFINNQLNVSEIPSDLEEDIRNTLINQVTYTLATRGQNVTIDNETYEYRGDKGNFKQLTKTDGTILQLTYSQIQELIRKMDKNEAAFFIKNIKLQGSDAVIKTIFTDKIKHRIKELNGNYDINIEENEGELIISNERLYVDKNIFFNNMAKLNFDYSNYASTKYAENNQDAFKVDIETMSNIFYDTLMGTLQNKLVVQDDQAAVTESFRKWWASIGKTSFETVLNNNPTQIYEIASKSAEANVAGMLGETLMSLFLSSAPIDNSVVKVLGQTTHGNGQAAVDLKVMFTDNKDSIKNVGFQIKQYASVESGNKADLYSNTSLKLSDAKMRRYLEDSFLQKIRSIFFDKTATNYWLEKNGIRDNSIREVSNILNSHLMYFIRYDEAQMKEGTFNEIEQNNFYVINFRFIPASSLFILAARAIGSQVKELEERQDFFFFSENQEHIKKQNNIMSSLIRYIDLEATQKASKNNNLCTFMENDLKLNFNGFSVNFKQQLDSVLKNAK